MRTLVTTAAMTAALALALFGCNKQDPATGSKTGEQTAAPASTQKAPAPAPVQQARVQGAAAAAPGSQPTSMPVNPHAAGKLPPGHPPAGGMPPGHPPAGAGKLPPGHPPAGGMPPGHPPAGGAPAMPAPGVGGTLTGKIELDAGMKAKVKAGSVLFIIVRQDAGEGQRGMLLAAKKVPVTGADMFPLNYTVGPQDVMMQGTQLGGNVRVEARVDQDGDAISKTPGDVVGALGKAVRVGAKGLDFTLNQSL